MTIAQAVEGQQECKKEKDAMRPNAPHLRESSLIKCQARAIKKKQLVKARAIEMMMTKEHHRH